MVIESTSSWNSPSWSTFSEGLRSHLHLRSEERIKTMDNEKFSKRFTLPWRWSSPQTPTPSLYDCVWVCQVGMTTCPIPAPQPSQTPWVPFILGAQDRNLDITLNSFVHHHPHLTYLVYQQSPQPHPDSHHFSPPPQLPSITLV